MLQSWKDTEAERLAFAALYANCFYFFIFLFHFSFFIRVGFTYSLYWYMVMIVLRFARKRGLTTTRIFTALAFALTTRSGKPKCLDVSPSRVHTYMIVWINLVDFKNTSHEALPPTCNMRKITSKRATTLSGNARTLLDTNCNSSSLCDNFTSTHVRGLVWARLPRFCVLLTHGRVLMVAVWAPY